MPSTQHRLATMPADMARDPQGLVFWPAVRIAYITSEMTLQAVAVKFDLPYESVLDKYSVELWEPDRASMARLSANNMRWKEEQEPVASLFQGSMRMVDFVDSIIEKLQRSLAIIQIYDAIDFRRVAESVAPIIQMAYGRDGFASRVLANSPASLAFRQLPETNPTITPEAPISTEEAIRQVEASLERLRSMEQRPIYNHPLPNNEAVPAFLRPRG